MTELLRFILVRRIPVVGYPAPTLCAVLNFSTRFKSSAEVLLARLVGTTSDAAATPADDVSLRSYITRLTLSMRVGASLPVPTKESGTSSFCCCYESWSWISKIDEKLCMDLVSLRPRAVLDFLVRSTCLEDAKTSY